MDIIAFAIIAVFAYAGGVIAIHEYYTALAFVCIPVAAICTSIFVAPFVGAVSAVVLAVCLIAGGIVHLAYYDD